MIKMLFWKFTTDNNNKIGARPLIFANFNPYSPKMLPTKFGSNQFSGFGGEVI